MDLHERGPRHGAIAGYDALARCHLSISHSAQCDRPLGTGYERAALI